MTALLPPAPEKSDASARAGMAMRDRLGSVASRGIRFAALVMLLALLVGIFALVRISPFSASSQTTTAGSASGQYTNTASQPPANQERAAPDFTLPTLAGVPFQLAAQRGHVVILYFFATGCAGCEPGSADLAQTLASSHLRGVEALAIDVNGTDRPSDLMVFVRSLNTPASASLQWGIDTTGAVSEAYGVQALETTVVIDPQGQIAYRSDGAISPAQLLQIVRKLA
jgi:peroxiredoxin